MVDLRTPLPNRNRTGWPHLPIIVTMATCILILMINPCHASLSGLLVVPTADIVETGKYEIQPALARRLSTGGEEAYALGTKFGPAPRVEAGVDFGLGGEISSHIWLDAKYLLAPSTRHSPAVAAGAYGVAAEEFGGLYIVSTQSFGGFRGHLGLLRTEDGGAWFVGADTQLSERWLLEADYTSGEDYVSSIGAVYLIRENISIEGGLLFSSRSDEGNTLVLDVTFAGSLFKH